MRSSSPGLSEPSHQIARAVRPIGGFFGLAIDAVPPVGGSVWEEWTRPVVAASKFGNARAALVTLINAIGPRRIWLPAYFCPEVSSAVATAAAECAAEVHNYGLTDKLEPDVGSLRTELAAGDMVVVVDYFGWLPSRAFRNWTRERPDVVWVEDRAQALWAADPPWAPWCIYSPRKLLGVPNGGILLGGEVVLSIATGSKLRNLTVALPEMMRYEDHSEEENDRWYAAYREREQGFAHCSGSISPLTEALLKRIPIAPLASARQANYRYLLDRLRPLAPWPRDAEDIAPFGLAIAVEDSQNFARQLAAERLFCARHWPDIDVDAKRFPFEHALSRQLLTLPCDHRYTPEQLARLADAIERLAPKPGCIS